MAIFDDITDFLKPLSDVTKDVKDFVGEDTLNILGKGLQGITRTDKAAGERAKEANKLLREDLMPIGQRYEAGRSRWGLESYAPDPMATERMWQSILTQFLTPNATKGSK